MESMMHMTLPMTNTSQPLESMEAARQVMRSIDPPTPFQILWSRQSGQVRQGATRAMGPFMPFLPVIT